MAARMEMMAMTHNNSITVIPKIQYLFGAINKLSAITPDQDSLLLLKYKLTSAGDLEVQWRFGTARLIYRQSDRVILEPV